MSSSVKAKPEAKAKAKPEAKPEAKANPNAENKAKPNPYDEGEDFHILSKDGTLAVSANGLEFNQWALSFEQGNAFVGDCCYMVDRELLKLINFLKSTELSHHYKAGEDEIEIDSPDSSDCADCDGRTGTAFYRMGSKIMIIDHYLTPIIHDCSELTRMVEQLYAQYKLLPKSIVVFIDSYRIYATKVKDLVWGVEICSGVKANGEVCDGRVRSTLHTHAMNNIVAYTSRLTTQSQGVEYFPSIKEPDQCDRKYGISVWLMEERAVLVDKGLRPLEISRRILRDLFTTLLEKCMKK